jgi:hypothetical protein
MNTAVQICTRTRYRRRGPRTELVCGTPRALSEGRFGPIAVFASDALVAYRLRHRRRESLYVFRTLPTDDPFAAKVPGVRPGVRLLVSVRTKGRVRLVQGLFGYLARRGSDPSRVSDGFWFRVGALLGGRLPKHKILVSLLSREASSP